MRKKEKFSQSIAVAVKEGGPDPDNNSRLRDVIAKAKANNMPNDTIERGIKKAAGDADDVYARVKDQLDKQYEIKVLEPYGFNNTYTLAMEPEVAQKYNIETYSDLTEYSRNFVFSPTLAFENREDGLPGLQQNYDLKFKDIKSMDGALRYQALKKGDAQVIDAYSTDGLLKKFNLKVLKDDKEFFPPYYAVPLVREEVVKEHPEVKEILNKLSDSISP